MDEKKMTPEDMEKNLAAGFKALQGELVEARGRVQLLEDEIHRLEGESRLLQTLKARLADGTILAKPALTIPTIKK